jgi:hypothetical protein
MRNTKESGIRIVLTLFMAAASWASMAAEDARQPAVLSAEQKKAFAETCEALAQSFLKNDKDAFQKLLIPIDQMGAVFSPELLNSGAEQLHEKIVAGDLNRFAELRARFSDLSGFEFSSGTVGYPLSRADVYLQATPVLENSYFIIAYANRLVLNVKLEELVYVGGKYYLTKLD